MGITKPNSAPLFDLAQSGVHCDTHSAYSEAAKRWTLVSFWSSAGREMTAVVVQSPRQKKKMLLIAHQDDSAGSTVCPVFPRVDLS